MGPEGSTVVLGVHREARGPQEMGSGPGDFFEVTLVRAAHVAGMRDQNVAPIGIKVLRIVAMFRWFLLPVALFSHAGFRNARVFQQKHDSDAK